MLFNMLFCYIYITDCKMQNYKTQKQTKKSGQLAYFDFSVSVIHSFGLDQCLWQ